MLHIRMHITCDIDDIFQLVEKGDFKEAVILLGNLKEKLLSFSGIVESVLIDGFKPPFRFKLFSVLRQPAECEDFKVSFCNFLLDVMLLFPEQCISHYEKIVKIAFSGFMCSKSAKLKTSWLRVFRKALNRLSTDSINENLLGMYSAHLFAQLAARQVQTVGSALCLSLATIVSRIPTPTSSNRERLLSYRVSFLSRKITEPAKRPEHLSISAALSSLSKILCIENRTSQHEDVKKCYTYAVEVLLTDLDTLKKYKPILSACKLLRRCSIHFNKFLLEEERPIILHLQTLADHRNSHLANAAREAYFSLLMCYRNPTRSDANFSDSRAAFLRKLTSHLIDLLSHENRTPTKICFSVKGLSILTKINEELFSVHEALALLSRVMNEITQLVDDISGNLGPQSACWLPELIESAANLLASRSSQVTSLSISRVLNRAVILSFEAYPRFSFRLAEHIGYSIFNMIDNFANASVKSGDDFTQLLDEVFYHAVLLTCSNAPFDLEISESRDPESESDSEALESDVESIRQPSPTTSGASPGDSVMSRISFREYLPLWRYLLGLPSGFKKEKPCRNLDTSALVCRLLLSSVLRILKRLDFSYNTPNETVAEAEPRVIVSNPQDVLLPSNIAAFLEQLLPECPTSFFDNTIAPFLQSCLDLTEKYPLLSGLYRLLALSISIARRSGYFTDLPDDTQELARLRSFATSLLASLQTAKGLLPDDLCVSRCACLLSLPLLIFPLSEVDCLCLKLARVVASTSLLVRLHGRCAHLAGTLVCAVESWLAEVKSDRVTHAIVFATLVPALVGILEISYDPGTTRDYSFAKPFTGQKSRHSPHKARLLQTLRAITRRPNAMTLDHPIGEAQTRLIQMIGRNASRPKFLTSLSREEREQNENFFAPLLPDGDGIFNNLKLSLPFPDLKSHLRLSDRCLVTQLLAILLWRQRSVINSTNQVVAGISCHARICAAEYLHEFIILGLANQRTVSETPADPLSNSDLDYWSLLFHVTFILGSDSDLLIRRLFRCLAFQLVHWFAGYPIASRCIAKVLQKTILRILSLTSPEDDIYCFLDKNFLLPDAVRFERRKLAAECLRHYVEWMGPRVPGSPDAFKRSSSVSNCPPVEEFLQQLIERLCRDRGCPKEGASFAFTYAISPLLNERTELATRYIYLFIDVFTTSISPESNQNSTTAALKKSVELLIRLSMKYPNIILLDDENPLPRKLPKLTRVCAAPSHTTFVEPLKPRGWESASVSSCVESLLLASRDTLHANLFRELIQQLASSFASRVCPRILSDSGRIISMFEWDTNSRHGFVHCLESYSWVLSSGLMQSESLHAAIQAPSSKILAAVGKYCTAPMRPHKDCSLATLNFIHKVLTSRSSADISVVFHSAHPPWAFIAHCLLRPQAVGLDDKNSKLALEVLAQLPSTFLTPTLNSLRQILQSHGLTNAGAQFNPPWLNQSADDDSLPGSITGFASIVRSVSRLLDTVRGNNVICGMISEYFSVAMCQQIVELAERKAFSLSNSFAELIQAILLIASSLGYKISCSTDLLSDIIHQSGNCFLTPSNLLELVDVGEGSLTLSTHPNVLLSMLSKLLNPYSRKADAASHEQRPGQLCDSIANVWNKRVDPLLVLPGLDKELCADLLETIISTSNSDLDRNVFVTSYLNLLGTESPSSTLKMKLLDMLAFFLQLEVIPANYALTNDRRAEIVKAVCFLLASTLPTDREEVAGSPKKLADCTAMLRSILSLVETTGCADAVHIASTVFCRRENHFMDEDLDGSLKAAMTRFWLRPAAQEKLLSSAVEAFDVATRTAHSSIGSVKLWHNYFNKVLRPLLLSVGASALERFAVRNVSKCIECLECSLDCPNTATQWLWGVLTQTVILSIFTVLYNRLSKTILHGMVPDGVGSVLRAFLGPHKTDGPGLSQVKGTELTACLIRKAHIILQDTLQSRTLVHLHHDAEMMACADTLRRGLWAAGLSCLVAAVSATQISEKFYNYVLIPDLLPRLLPDSVELRFPRTRSGKYKSAFVELREEFWLPSEREPGFGSANSDSPRRQQAFSSGTSTQRRTSSDLLQTSSFSVEINRFRRTSGTQIMQATNAVKEFVKPISPSKSAAAVADTIQEPEPLNVHVNLEVDCLNTTSPMVCFVSLLKHMHHRGIFKTVPSKKGVTCDDMPAIMRYFYDHFTSSATNDNVRAFIAKLVINCTEVFKPFARLWLPVLLAFVTSGADVLKASASLSSLAVDICLLLGEWGESGDAAPHSHAAKATARALLAALLHSGDAHPHPSMSRLSLELFDLLVGAWLPAGVPIPYRELLAELQVRQDYKQTAFKFHLFKAVLSSCDKFNPMDDNLDVAHFANLILKHMHQSQKTLVVVVWECAGLLISKCAAPSEAFDDEGIEVLRSNGIDILPLSRFPPAIHPLVAELWSRVHNLNPAHRCTRPSDAPITVMIEAACAAASYWSALGLHLTNSLLIAGIPDDIEPALFSHCLRMFAKLTHDLTEGKFPRHVGESTKVEIFTKMANSNLLDQIRRGTAAVLFTGTLLILRLVQFAMTAASSENFATEKYHHLILQLVQTLVAALLRPNATPDSRRVAYRTFVTALNVSTGPLEKAIKDLCSLGLAYGLCGEEDAKLRRLVRRHMSQHCLNATLQGLPKSSSRCISALALLSSGRHGNLADRPLLKRIMPRLLSSSLEIILEPAVKSVDFRYPIYQNPLDPHYPFMQPNSVQVAAPPFYSMLDPVVMSGIHQIWMTQSEASNAALAGTATLSFPEGTTSDTQLMATQAPPSSSSSYSSSSFSHTNADTSFSGVDQAAFAVPKVQSSRNARRTEILKEKKLSRADELRQKLVFAATITTEAPAAAPGATQPDAAMRGFYRQRSIHRQRAEFNLIAGDTTTLFHSDCVGPATAHLCCRHRPGALPDVQALRPEGFVKPLFQLAASGCGPVILTLVLESLLDSPHTARRASFLRGLGGALAGLMASGQASIVPLCLSLVWYLSGVSGEILCLAPEPSLIVASATSTGRVAAGILLLEELLCVSASGRPNGSRQLSLCTPWTASRRRIYPLSFPSFVLPDVQIDLLSTEGISEPSSSSTCWWQLTRLYIAAQRGDEILGWLCDRWAGNPKTPHWQKSVLECVGEALLAEDFGDYEGAFSELSELITTYPNDDEAQANSDDNAWATCPSGLNAELRLVCREELLQCLQKLGSWQDLDQVATTTAISLAPEPEDACVREPSTSNATICEFDSLWMEPYAMESVLPLVISSRLQACLCAEINKAVESRASAGMTELERFRQVMDSGLRSTSDLFESKFAYELTMLSVLESDWDRAQLRCSTAFKTLAQTWSSLEDSYIRLEKAQLLTEVKEFVEITSGTLNAVSSMDLLHKWYERCIESDPSEELTTCRLFLLSKLAGMDCLSIQQHLVPAVVDLGLAGANACLRTGNSPRSINQLNQLRRLTNACSQSGSDNGYRQLAWCNAFSRAWKSVHTLTSVLYCSTGRATARFDLENGLSRCLSLSSRCIETYEGLRQPPSFCDADVAVIQFSHAISIAQILSSLDDLQKSGRLSDAGSKHLNASLLPALKARFSRIQGLEVSDEDFLQSSALAFFKRCLELARCVMENTKAIPSSAEQKLCRRNLLVYTPEDALLEVANFCNAHMIPGIRSDAYAHAFVSAVLTAMYLGSDGGSIRFSRALQITTSCAKFRQHSDASTLGDLFREMTKDLPVWMFLQWSDCLLNALVNGASELVADILRRVACLFPQALSFPFRIEYVT
uniref:4Fe-4S ferredoxin-type domain-containing protein n=1 Tax=Mesocestoides corti TaxID=53468 RepID=A0A5K3EKX9_MESCO